MSRQFMRLAAAVLRAEDSSPQGKGLGRIRVGRLRQGGYKYIIGARIRNTA